MLGTRTSTKGGIGEDKEWLVLEVCDVKDEEEGSQDCSLEDPCAADNQVYMPGSVNRVSTSYICIYM